MADDVEDRDEFGEAGNPTALLLLKMSAGGLITTAEHAE
jgi:hypothetical protein